MRNQTGIKFEFSISNASPLIRGLHDEEKRTGSQKKCFQPTENMFNTDKTLQNL